MKNDNDRPKTSQVHVLMARLEVDHAYPSLQKFKILITSFKLKSTINSTLRLDIKDLLSFKLVFIS